MFLLVFLSYTNCTLETLKGGGCGEKEVPLEAYYPQRLQRWYGGI